MGARMRRVLLILLALVLLALVAAAVTLYLMAAAAPEDYAPARLSASERARRAREFTNKVLLRDFYNEVQRSRPFEMTLTEGALNAYLASADEIAGNYPHVKPGTVDAWMEEKNLAEPAIALHAGYLTLMVRSAEFNKVLSVDVAPVFEGEGSMRVELRGVRVGTLPVPERLVADQLGAIRSAMRGQGRRIERREGSPGISADDLAAALGSVLGAMGGGPISTTLPRDFDGRIVRLDALEIDEETLRIRFNVRPAEGA